MGSFFKTAVAGMVLACAVSAAAQGASPTIRSVSVLGAGESMEVEVVASTPVTAQTQVANNPERLIIDFPNTVPDPKLRNLIVNRGELKGVRVGLFAANPPVTRVVLDLKTPQSYQIFPSGKTVIVKLHPGNQTQAMVQTTSMAPSTPAQPVAPPKPTPRFDVEFKNGNLKIWADHSTLAEVLNEVRKRTGAEISIPPGGGQEPIVANVGPAPAREVLASLLNGSQFNFVILGSDRNPSQLRAVFLTMRNGGGMPDTSVSYPAVAADASQGPPMRGMDPEPEIQPEPIVEQNEPAPQQDMAPQPNMAQPPPPEENPQQ